MTANIIRLRPHKSTHTKSDTIEVNAEVIRSWKSPPFQRPLRDNARVVQLADSIKADGGVIPGVITLGVLDGDTYLIDGQHRIYAFTLSQVVTGYADVRVHHFDDMASMGEEFVNLNSRLVNFKPDDILRGLEESMPALRLIRQKCPYVGYDMIRRGPGSPILSMSTLLRTWCGSGPETPTNGGAPAVSLARDLTLDEAENLTSALYYLERAWGRGDTNARLWGALNLSLCFWMWRRLVITQYSAATTRLTKELFMKCMMSLAADEDYSNWLLGRRLGDRDRSPAFSKIKAIMAKRIETETEKKPRLPQPTWSKS